MLHILAIRVCAAAEGMVFKPCSLGLGLVIIENWSRLGSRLTGLLEKIEIKNSSAFLLWYYV